MASSKQLASSKQPMAFAKQRRRLPRWGLLSSLGLAVLLTQVLPVGAYPDDAPPRKKRGDFDFGVPPSGGDKERPGTDRPRTPADRSATAIANEIEAMRNWPGRKAQRAAEQLFMRGSSAVPYLVRTLEGEDPGPKPGAAWVLGKVGQDVHVQVILKAATKRTNGSRAETFFRAAYSLSPAQCKRWMISFLTLSNRPVFRSAATKFLQRKLDPEDRGRVLQLLDARKPYVRISGLQLLRAAGVRDADDRLEAAISDLYPTVAYQAARLLGTKTKPKTIVRLNELVRDGDARERAYATLALVEVARGSNQNPFEESTVESLAGRRGIMHPEKLSRGAAAAGMAYGAVDVSNPEISGLLDNVVVSVLIDAVGGTHFRDYESVKPAAFASLRKLSGKTLPDSAVAWAQWWQASQGSFHARRPLQQLDASDVAMATVQFHVVEANGMRRGATFVPAGGSSEANDVLLLKQDAFQALVEFLGEMGVFSAKNGGSTRADESVSVVVRVTNQQRRMVVGPEGDRTNEMRPYARLKLRFDALADANQWQLYVDKDMYANRQAWWERNVDLMASAGPDERKRFLQSAIIHAFDDLPDDMARARALYRLQQMGGPVGPTEAALLAEHLAGAPAFGAMEADGLRWLLNQGDARIRENLLSTLAQRTEEKAQDILAAILVEGGVEVIRNGFSDPRTGMRAAAAHASRLYLDGSEGTTPSESQRVEVGLRLRPGLEVLAHDPDAGVSIRALLGLAYLGDEGVIDRLERIYKTGNLGAKLEVTRALGYVPGKKTHTLLTLIVGEEREVGSTAIRAAALQSMARSKHKDAVRLLAYYLLNDASGDVQDAAADAMVTMGTDDARFEIIDMLTQGESKDSRRARLVDTLGRFEGDVVKDQLKRYLGDPAPQVAFAASVRGAEHGLGESVPYLIRFLRKGEGIVQPEAVKALETVTSVRFDEPGYSARADRYQGWYDINTTGTPRTWYRDALKARGYEVTSLGAYIKGEHNLDALPVLVRALRDSDDVIRRNASRALTVISGRTFGKVTRETSIGEAAEIANKWADWHNRRIDDGR